LSNMVERAQWKVHVSGPGPTPRETGLGKTNGEGLRVGSLQAGKMGNFTTPETRGTRQVKEQNFRDKRGADKALGVGVEIDKGSAETKTGWQNGGVRNNSATVTRRKADRI